MIDPLLTMARDATLDEIAVRLAEHPLPADRGVGALAMAAAWQRLDVMRLLLDAGVPPGAEVLHAAVHGIRSNGLAGGLAASALLIDRGADVDGRHRGRTALASAAYVAGVEAVRFLLGHGARVELATEEGKTPLALVLERDYVDFCGMFDNRPPSEESFLAVERLLREAGATR